MTRIPLLFTALALSLVLVAPASASNKVLVKDSYFSPSSLTVSKGTTLRFVWRGNLLHNVASGGKILISNRKKGSGRVKIKRSMKLVCTLHSGMDMKVRVR